MLGVSPFSLSFLAFFSLESLPFTCHLSIVPSLPDGTRGGETVPSVTSCHHLVVVYDPAYIVSHESLPSPQAFLLTPDRSDIDMGGYLQCFLSFGEFEPGWAEPLIRPPSQPVHGVSQRKSVD